PAYAYSSRHAHRRHQGERLSRASLDRAQSVSRFLRGARFSDRAALRHGRAHDVAAMADRLRRRIAARVRERFLGLRGRAESARVRGFVSLCARTGPRSAARHAERIVSFGRVSRFRFKPQPELTSRTWEESPSPRWWSPESADADCPRTVWPRRRAFRPRRSS